MATRNRKHERSDPSTSARKYSFPLLTGLIAIAPLLIDFTGTLFDYAETPKQAWIQTGAVVLLLVWGYQFGKKPLKIRKDALLIPLLVFCAWSAVSLLWAASHEDVIGRLVHWIACIVFYLLIVNLSKDEWEAEQFLKYLLLVAGVISLIGLAQACYSFSWIYQSRAPAATFANKNLAAEYLTFVFPLLIIAILKANRNRTLLLTSEALALLVNYVYFNRSKAVWLALALQCLVLGGVFLIERLRSGRLPFQHFWKKAGIAVSMAFLSFAFLQVTTPSRGPQQESVYEMIKRTLRSAISDPNLKVQRSDSTPDLLKPEEQDSLSVRTAVWRNALQMVKDNPVLGVGYGNFQVVYPRYAHSAVWDSKVTGTEHWQAVHNDYLQILVETGVVGLVLFGWVIVAFLRLASASFRQKARAENDYLSIACIAGLLGTGVNMFFSFPLEVSVTPLMMAVFLGILARQTDSQDSSAGEYEQTLPLTGRALALMALIPLLFAARFAIYRFAGDLHMGNVFRAQSQEVWPLVITEGQQVLDYFPDWHEPHQSMSHAYLELNDPVSAIKATDAVLKVRPYYVNALYNRGAAHLLLQEDEKALEDLKRVVDLVPTYANAHHALARLYLDRHSFNDAEREASLAVKYFPQNPQHYYGLALATMGNREFQKAIDALDRAIQIDNTNVQFHYNRALALIRVGRLEDAQASLEKAEQLQPDFKQAKALKARVATLIGERQRTEAKPSGKQQ